MNFNYNIKNEHHEKIRINNPSDYHHFYGM